MRFTYAAAFNPSSDPAITVNWARLTAALPPSLTAEQRDALLHANVGSIIMFMPWQCAEIDDFDSKDMSNLYFT